MTRYNLTLAQARKLKWDYYGLCSCVMTCYGPNGDVDGFMDGGDWGEAEFTAKGLGHVAGRAAVFAWADTLTG